MIEFRPGLIYTFRVVKFSGVAEMARQCVCIDEKFRDSTEGTDHVMT